MNDQQLLFILEKKYSGCKFSTIRFTGGGSMSVRFFDNDGKLHEQVLNTDGTITYFGL